MSGKQHSRPVRILQKQTLESIHGNECGIKTMSKQMSHNRERNPLLVRKISRNSKHARNLIYISISVEPVYLVHLTPLASVQAEVCSTLISIPW